ncbi:MAG: dihydrolipoyl dehydrogenase [Candidatus Rokubacteria bacterium]|nr:dihydrolipoyl dehydrogenase [Candidatus Rokubacteria bacterium]
MVMGDLAREVDLVVIGGGPGGYSAAFRAAELGLETAVIDVDARLGGTCLHEGCIPSKALLHVAAVIAEAARVREAGVEFGAPRVSLDVLRKWTAERVIGKLARGLAASAKAKDVEVIAGHAAFEDSRTIRVEGEASQALRFRHALIATGSAAVGLPGTSFGDRVLDARRALELPDVPGRLLVIGGGYIGLELGTVYAALGSRVRLVEMTAELLPGVDRDLVEPLERRCRGLFEAIHLERRVTALEVDGDGVQVEIASEPPARFDRVLVAVGRRARTDGLGLERTEVRPGVAGAVAVDARCRTADPRIFAVGDATGEPMLAHRAMRQGKVAAEVISGRPSAVDNAAVPAVVFTDPEIAWCGMTERQAAAEGRPVTVARFPWGGSGRAATLGRSDGLTKLILDPGSGRVVGVGIAGPGAAELIAEGALAVETAALAEDVAATIHAHPTLGETLMEAAESFLR